MKDESTHKSELSVEFATLRDWLMVKHEDVRTAGTPDVSLTGAGVTTWWEGKVIGPGKHYRDRRVQVEIAAMLDRVGTGARFLVWEYDAVGTGRTLIMTPRQVWDHFHCGAPRVAETTIEGHSPRLVAGLMRTFNGERRKKLSA